MALIRNRQLSIGARLLALSLSAIVGILLMAAATLWSEYHLIVQERQHAVRQNVESARTLLVHFHSLAEKGTLSEGEAKAQAAAAVGALRYSGGEYFWINDMGPTMVMHPMKPELNGRDLSTNADPNGKKLFVEFVKVVKAQEAGFVDYIWPKPQEKNPQPKTSYVAGFKPWGWVVGSGVYVDSVETAVLSRAAMLASATLVLMGVLAGFGWYISRGLLRQMGGEPNYAVAIAENMAQGDLSMEVSLRPNDSHSLLYAMNSMRSCLFNLVHEIRHGTDAIALASGEIAAGNNDLSYRTEQQASSLQQTAAAMEQITSNVRHNADHAAHASGLAAVASEVAQRGGTVVNQVVQTMGRVNASSRKIVDIIAVIDGIAFQTSLLALNASVEAARAGPQGRGFAVVASEVRSLAQRSSEAAKEIKQLIHESVANVEQGTQLVDAAGSTMGEVVTSVRGLSEIIAQIADASAEQSTGLHQINQAVSEMDNVTQQNAALVEQAASAAESLSTQAGRLAELVSTFRLA